MNRRRIVALVALVIGVAAVVWFSRPLEREPVYKGKPLSYWLRRELRMTSEDEIRQHEAILAIGSNALPFLVEWMRYEPRPWELRLIERAPVFERLYKTRLDLAWETVDGFEVLRTTGSNAVPALRELVRGTNSEAGLRAIHALELIGRPAIPTLLDVVTNYRIYPENMHWALSGTTSLLGTNAELMIPGLLSCLESGDQRPARIAAMLLGEVGGQPKTVVPALVRCAESTNFAMRYCAILSLGGFEGRAREGVPTLMRALEDPNRSMRVNVTNALRKIAPEVLEGRERR